LVNVRSKYGNFVGNIGNMEKAINVENIVSPAWGMSRLSLMNSTKGKPLVLPVNLEKV
jgi:hypothetical protein